LRSVAACLCILLFFVVPSCVLRELHSFPTRRSSDLAAPLVPEEGLLRHLIGVLGVQHPQVQAHEGHLPQEEAHGLRFQHGVAGRSEEHTSELQSRFDLVCRLLLEKKKTNNKLTSARL